MSILNNVKTKDNIKQAAANKPPLIVIYGKAGSGKTTFCATAPRQLFMNIEDGIQSLQDSDLGNVHMTPQINSKEDANKWLDALIKEKHQYKTLVVDSITKMDLIFCSEIKGHRQSIADLPQGSGWSKWRDAHSDFWGKLELVRRSGVAVILIAHAEMDNNTKMNSVSFKYHHPYINNADIVGFMENRELMLSEKPNMHQGKNRCGITENIKINLNEHWTKSQFFNSIDFYKNLIPTKPQVIGD